MAKLLTEEELRNTLLLDILHATNVTGRHIEDLVNLIQSQKLAHGEMVIGRQKPYKGGSYGYWAGQNDLRDEQRQALKQLMGGKE